MDYEAIRTFFTVLIAIAGCTVTFTGAITGIAKIRELLGKNKRENMLGIERSIKEHNDEITNLKSDINQLKRDVRENKDMTVLICKGVKSLMDNSITGNGIDNLKKTRKELDDYLIENVR